MAELIDISVALSEDIPVWPGSTGFRHTWTARIGAGSPVNNSRIECDLHVGTHIDAPLHFVADGIPAEQIDLERLVGRAYVADAGTATVISADLLGSMRIPDDTRRLLLRTSNSAAWESGQREFNPDFVALTGDAATWIVSRNIHTVGIDYLSIQRFHDGPETHQILLGAGVIVIEGLNLHHVDAGWYELTCLPLKLKGAEGAPARAVLRPLPDQRRHSRKC